MSDLRSGNSSEYLSSRNDVLAGLANLPKQAAEGSRSLTGIPGESRNATHLLIYPTLDQSRFIEIPYEDIVASQSLSPEESPFGAAGGVRVMVRQNATITSGLVTAKDGEARDDFDLDIRLGTAGRVEKRDDGDDTENGDCGDTVDECDNTGDVCDQTDDDECILPTEGDCNTDVADCGVRTRDEDTCVTCGECKTIATCATCGRQTCATCETCETCVTCVTCEAECKRPTLEGCETAVTRCAGDCEVGTRVTCSPECHPK